ncbi:MAG: chemotaxis protein CheW [Spirochaetota bacterium]
MEKQQIESQLNEETDQIISFVVGRENFGVLIREVKEVIRIREITRLPKAPDFVKGVINLRGDVIPVIDLREKFSMEVEDYTDMTRVIVVEVDGKSIGMVVDSVSHVLRLSRDQIDPAPPLVGGLAGEYIKGVGKLDEKLIILLNIERILSHEEKIELDQLQQEVAETAGVG